MNAVPASGLDTLPPIGGWVHVNDQGAGPGICRPALVMGYTGGATLALRVFRTAPRTAAVGSEDAEANYPPAWDPTVVPDPDGGSRELDSWHWPYHR